MLTFDYQSESFICDKQFIDNNYTVEKVKQSSVDEDQQWKFLQFIMNLRLLLNSNFNDNFYQKSILANDQRKIGLVDDKMIGIQLTSKSSYGFKVLANAQIQSNFPHLDNEQIKKVQQNSSDARKIQLSFNTQIFQDKDIENDYQGYDRDIQSSDSRMLLALAPEPVLGQNLNFAIARSADCNTYTFTWSYTSSIGANDRTDVDIKNIATTAWGIVINSGVNALSSSSAQTFANLKTTYGYYLGQSIYYRMRVKSTTYDYSNYYLGTSDTSILKQLPSAIGTITFSQSMTALTLTWADLASTWTSTTSVAGTGNDVVTYQVQKCLSSSCAYANYGAVASTASIYYTLPDTTNLNWNIAYKFKVASINTCGSVYSAEYSYTILSSLPVAMAVPTLVTRYGTTISISWTGLTSASDQGYRAITGYSLMFCLSTTCLTPTADTGFTTIADTLSTSFSQTGRTTPIAWSWGQTYYFRVKARNGVGLGPAATTYLTVVMPRVAQVAPVLTLVSKSMTSLSFSWTAVTADADLGNNPFLYYVIDWSLYSSFSPLMTGLPAQYSTTFTLNKASYVYAANTYYYFRISVYNQAGTGVYSSTLTVLTPTVPVQMAVPTAPTVTPTSIVINWTQLTTAAETGYESISYYYLYKCTGSSICTPTGYSTFSSSTSSYSETYTVATTPRGVYQRYSIFAQNSVGSGTMSPILTFITDNIPTSMTAVTCSDVQPKSMTVTWPALDVSYNGGDPIVFYGVEYSTNNFNFYQLNFDYTNLYLTYTYSQASNFAANTIYYYRVRSKNGIDYGPYSTTITCTTDTYPTGMSALSYGQVNPMNIVINWSELTDTTLNGRDVPIYYQLEWYNQEIATYAWQILTSESNGKVFTFTHTRTTVFPSGKTQQYRMVAKNNIGLGTGYSATLNVAGDSVPTLAIAPTIAVSDIYPQKVIIYWAETPVASNGGDTIIYYLLEWDQGSSTWVSLNPYSTGLALPTSYTHTFSVILTSGGTYKYRVTALNGVGYGAVSTATSMTADATPTSCNNPVIATADIIPQQSKITWTAIADTYNGRDPVIFYLLEWDQGSTNWVSLNTYTSGMDIPYSYTHNPSVMFPTGSSQKYRLTAKNGVGYSTTQCITTMTADAVPTACNAPVIAVADIQPQQAKITWTAITDVFNGGDPVIFYLLEWDSGTNNWVSLNTYTSGMEIPYSYTHNPSAMFPTGSTQKYRLTAKNGVGYGVVSPSTSMTADAVPTACNAPFIAVADIMPQQSTITWTAIADASNGGDPIIFYLLEWEQSTSNWVSLNSYTSGMAIPYTYTHTPSAMFPTGSTQNYRLTAKNGVGYGVVSASTSMTADEVPTACNAPAIAVNDIMPQQSTITWTAIADASNGRDPVIFYLLEWEQSTGVWTALNSYTSNMEIPYAHTHNPSAMFPSGSTQKYRLTAKNGVGYGVVSASSSMTADEVPIACNAPVIAIADIMPQQSTITWTAIADANNGRDPVIFYLLEWEQSTGVWTTLNTYTSGMVIPYTYTHNPSAMFPSGSTQNYRLTAKNGVGYGVASTSTSMTADAVPTACNAPVIAVPDIMPQQVTITWTEIADADTGRDPVLFYLLEWDQGSTNWVSLNTYTSGMAIPYTYTHTPSAMFPTGSTQKYRLSAMNTVGYGVLSSETSMTADQVPTNSNAPTIADADIYPQKTTITWTDIIELENGRDPIIFYLLEWDQGQTSWTPLNTYTSGMAIPYTYTHEPADMFPTGSSQKYRITSKNGVGYSTVQSVTTITADAVPTACNSPDIAVADINPQNVTVTWTAINDADNGRDPVIFYLLEWDQGSSTWESLNTYTANMNIPYSYIHYPTNMFPTGSTQTYRLTAKNGVGYGVVSTPTPMTADEVPIACNDPIIADADIYPQKVTVTWTAINDVENGRDPIIFYRLDWDQGIGSWTPLNTYTDQMATPFTYVHEPSAMFPTGSTQTYRLYSKNGVGYSTVYGQLAITADAVPVKMALPQVSMTRYNQIDLYWTALTTDTEIGRDPILYYRIEFFDRPCYSSAVTCSTGYEEPTDGSWTDLLSTTTTIQLSYSHTTTTKFSDGKNYNYRVRAANGVGFGAYSDTLSVLTPTKPTFMNKPSVVSINPTNITLAWVALDNSTEFAKQGYDIITYYTIEVDTLGSGTYTSLNPTGSLVTIKMHSQAAVFQNNTIFKYRVAATNGMGMGAYSEDLSVTTDNVPQEVKNLATVSIAPKTIKVKWDALTTEDETGRDPVNYYKLEYHDNKATTAVWTELTSHSVDFVIDFQHDLTVPFPANRNMDDYFVKYRVSALNGVEYGVTTEIQILTKTYPKQMVPVTFSDPISSEVEIFWTKLTTDDVDTGRDPVVHYNAQWIKESATDDVWTTLTTYPYTQASIKINEANFEDNTWYRVRIGAQNGVGIGNYSDESLIQTDDLPNRLERMEAPTEDSSTNANLIMINWLHLTDILDTGRDPITYYRVYWDQGKSQWTECYTSPLNTMVLTYQWNSNIQNGTTYQFKVRPKNLVGDAFDTPILSVIPSSPPDQMSKPSVTLSNEDTMVKVTWSYPQDNGDSVKAYMVEFRSQDSFWYTINETCDGSQSSILSIKYCYVHMATLRADPFNLVKNDKIVVRINAMNIKGYNDSASRVQDSQFTLVVEVEPTAPGTPTRGSNTAYNILHTQWVGITSLTVAAGGVTSSITSYEIQRNLGNSTTDTPDLDETWVSLQGFNVNNTALTFQTSQDIVGGTTYKLRARAYNKYGWGDWSGIYEIICAQVPSAPTWVSIDNSTTNFLFKWQEPFNQGLSILRYYIAIQKKGTDQTKPANYIMSDDCPGDDLTVNLTQQCMVKMVTLRSTTYMYTLNDKIRVRIWAENLMGQGPATIWYTTSANNNAMVQTQPSAPTAAVTNYPLVTTDLKISISWVQLSSVNLWGGIKIDRYEIFWYDPLTFEDWELLFTDVPSFKLAYIHTKTSQSDLSVDAQSIIPGTLYKFRYRAVNIHGEGNYSPELSVYASTKPDQLECPVTSLLNTTVTIQWSATPNDHAQAVTKYSIKFKASNGSFIEDTGCSGTSLTVVQQLKCTMPMSKFTSSPFNLNIDTLIEVTVGASNVMGWSVQSFPNTVGVTAKKIPQAAPTSLARGVNTGKNTMHLTWVGLSTSAQTGGQAVDYRIYYDKATNQGTWSLLLSTTSNATAYQELNTVIYKTGSKYHFKVQAWNDFGLGTANSSSFGIWAAIVPSGLDAPTTSLSYNSYVEEDDIVVIDWEPPTDNGGLSVTYSIDVQAKSGTWTPVTMSSECYELNVGITNYRTPIISSTDAATMCTLMVSNLKSKYSLTVGDVVMARITATQAVGSVTSTSGGTAILPIVPCFRTTFPRVIGGSNSDSFIRVMDIDDNGHIVVGGHTQDKNLLENKVVSQTLPMAVYIAKGNYYQWAKYLQSTDTVLSTNFQYVSDITFRWDGEKIALALECSNYETSYTIVVLNKDGTFYGAYRESTNNAKGKVSPGGMIYDSANMITVGVDFSPFGTSTQRQAILNRFSVQQTTAGTFSTQFYLVGGVSQNSMISQVFALQRIRGDTSQFYLSALITDSSGNRRSILGKSQFSNGALQKYYVHVPGTDYNSDSSVAVVKRMNLDENDLLSQHIISACIMSQDNYRIHFGEFILSGVSTQTQTVLQVIQLKNQPVYRTPTLLTTYNKYNCLGSYSRIQGTMYFLYNYRFDPNPANYQLILGRVTVSSKKLDQLIISSHSGLNNYGGARMIHQSRIYYFGAANSIYNGNILKSQPKYQGWINIFDPLEWSFCCNPTTQSFTIPSTSISLDIVAVIQMDWKITGLTSTTGFANTVVKQMKSTGTFTGINNLNLAESLINNTWCPIVTTGGAPTITAPDIPNQMFTYNPDVLTAQTQSFQFDPITVSRYCPDTVIYNLTYLSNTNQALPTFITLKSDNNSYVFDVSTTQHVGTQQMMLMSVLGNNKSTSVKFTSQVASPCLNNFVAIPTYTIPVYDISEWSPKFVDLNWVVANATPSCGSVYQIFYMLNSTNGDPIDPDIFSIVNQSNGIQRIQIWTQYIPYARLWNTLLVNSYLQGDFVASKVFTINVTNDCEPTVITSQIMPNWIYYTGRDSIDLTFVWSETVGKCGPITYAIREYITTNVNSNNSLDSSIFTHPSVVNTNNTMKIFTADESKVGTYFIRVWASLGVGGYKQSSTLFSLQIIRDPCAYYTFTVPFIDDLTLWVNQTGQTLQIPFFKMSDPSWICNFTYVMTTGLNGAIDPIFIQNQVVPQGTNPTLTLQTTDKTKVDLSPYTIKVKGWPTRQPSSVALFITFRIYIAYFDKTDCTPGNYYNSVSETCVPCSAPCTKCTQTPTKCTWCQTNYIYVEQTNSCIAKTDPCPVGQKDPYLPICRQCSEFCKTCSDYQTCTVCIPNYSLANKKCYPPRNCPEGYTYNGVDCTQCSTNCASCVSSTICNYCKQGSYLNTLTNACVLTCPTGYYADQESRVCMVCSPACRTCVGNNYTCTSCRDVTVGSITTYKYLYGTTCVDRCPYLQYFQNHNNRSCDNCNPACKICVTAFDDCIVCNEGSVISGRSCLNSCPAKSYITVIGTCFPCDPACQICTGAMSSMCSECVAGQFLTQKTCDSKCNPPLFPDTPTKSCLPCPYYCNQCTTATDCQKCKTGYRQVPNSCEGEMFLRLNGQVQINVAIDIATAAINPRQITAEIWFKIDNPLSSLTEIILGNSPYKLRKKANQAQIQLNFDINNYCDSLNLKADQWYHFAYVIDEETMQLFCYLNGAKLSTGITAVALIAADVQIFKEITFGGSIDMKTSESKFTGYVKEFRWWQVARSPYQIDKFKDISFVPARPEMLAYWRLDEDRKTATAFKDSVKNLLVTPTAPLTLAMVVEMREIYLKICPEGFFGQFNDTSNMAECVQCDSSCRNCNGMTNTSCTECNSPYKLIEAEQKCVIVEGCPVGYYDDAATQQCQPCHGFCITCINSPTQCPKCKPKYFKQYKGLGCVDSCPRGLYGNYLTQSCAANPLVTSLLPDDGTIFAYGSFIDLYATFEVLNAENRATYSYGWIISKLNTNVDLAKDAAKPYFNTDITRVHLDNNILEPNFYYNITFYVKGSDTYYNGMIGSMYNVIYIGIPPKNGKCFIKPSQGIAGVTVFTVSTSGWVDVDGVGEYGFFYSFDGGDTFIPIKTSNVRLPSQTIVFDPIFQTLNAQIRCSAKSIKGFEATADTSFILVRRISASSSIELAKVNISTIADEKDAVKMSSQILAIAKDLGKLQDVDPQLFDAKISADQCTNAICSYQGRCNIEPFTKKYICKCDPGFAGVNCTFKNQTQLDIIRNKTLALCKTYNPMSLSGRRAYDYQFLNSVTSNMDLMSPDVLDAIFDIVIYKVNAMKTSTFNVGENDDVTQNMNILSNLLEQQYQHAFTLNQTNAWVNISDADAKKAKMIDDLNKTMNLVQIVRSSTLQRLSFLQEEIAVQTRMVSYRQVLQPKDAILTMPATSNLKKDKQTYVKISPSNFVNSSVVLTDMFIAEAAEYAINPYQVNNTDNVAANILEINLFNYNRKPDGSSILEYLNVNNLVLPIELSFPVSDNQNLSDFVSSYNKLSNFKYSDILKKNEMIKKSNLSCVYWDKINGNWSHQGCQLQGLDNSHIKCSCNHLSSFTILFATPKLTIDAPLLENTTVGASIETKRNVTLKDIIKWPLSLYFSNLQKLWQHNRPSFIMFITNPGFAVLVLFWAMYFSSLIYYSGRDDLKRFKMTKQQNRDDLAELKDDDAQNVMAVVRDLIVKDFIKDNSRTILKENRRLKDPRFADKVIKPPQMKIYETLSKEEQKKYKRRARKKVFGVPAGLCDRAKRVYDTTMKHNSKNPNAKMSFFSEELKNNLWIGLIAKSSKIAPRHVRLLLMYFYSSLYITLLTLIFAFQLQEYISDSALFQVVTLSAAMIVLVWVITIPVALIFRMPLHLRRMIAGVRTKKINKAFQMIDQHMGWRYAVGYFICLSMFFIMTVVVLVFNIFYPRDYVMGWFFNIILIYLFDMIVFTFALAAFQMACVIVSAKVKCFYHVWKAIEVFRYVKNLRG